MQWQKNASMMQKMKDNQERNSTCTVEPFQTRIMQNRYCNASFDVSSPNDIYNNHVHGLSDY